ncbi:hypothetical protein AQUCO_00100879v1 [Aquilegia coerulea]|uniref:PROP1-like PPR domain-containing protein n=1 Tax=Aquilegia coerulea TaxID=218851 RepID=A0A2G5FCH9_AQUCA|nr:hypothetical protein AQUCO_00100879v1 [Aquilegia coerulea]PIA65674.1 hypothetical protein AQUCO_00100879v1 [Aquilegia coerulea]PIA65675.1 hypothetical protein AQUCO_00100879v1 [Aquilegia coerulea]PIA65676.1 hypothetical protein AQUCO_00100879v1 [Aquilegia coerulea]
MFQNTVNPLLKNNHPQNGFLLILKKCKTIKQFKEIHAYFLKSDLPPLSIARLFSISVSNANLFSHARLIFKNLIHRNTFIYNTMIRGFVQSHSPVTAIFCYLEMLNFGLVANNYTFPPLIKACSAQVLPYSKLIGDLVHAHVIKFGFPKDPFVVTTLIELYSSVGDMGTARRLFDGIPKRDVVLWTAMIDGYGKMGDVNEARVLFDEMPERNVISWSAMMAAYSRVSDFKEVLSLFREMQETGVRPNDSVLVSVLTACANLGAFAQGLWIHSYVKHNNLDSNTILATAITDMYAKCGCVEAALSVFEGIKSKDVGAWNAMISGVAMNSDARKSLELFNRMCMDKAQPNETTFIAILTACTHAGLVDEGLTLFDQMSALYKLKPRLEHYACVVDLLARAGKLEEAEKFIDERIGGFSEGDANVWGALLGACRTYGNVEVGNRVWRKLAGLGVADCGTYMILYNMYKESGWDLEANHALKKIREMGMKKKPGCSLIEVDGVVDEFIASDISHPQAREIFDIVHSLFKLVNLESL